MRKRIGTWVVGIGVAIFVMGLTCIVAERGRHGHLNVDGCFMPFELSHWEGVGVLFGLMSILGVLGLLVSGGSVEQTE